MKFLVMGISAGLALAGAAPAGAQTLRVAWQACTGEGAVGLVQQINGCSNVIGSGLEAPKPRAVAFFNRAVLYQSQGAISQAIAKSPSDWSLWLVGSRIHREAGDLSAGSRDYAQARSLNPRSPLFSGAG